MDKHLESIQVRLMNEPQARIYANHSRKNAYEGRDGFFYTSIRPLRNADQHQARIIRPHADRQNEFVGIA